MPNSQTRTILVHVDRVRPGRLGLRVRVDLAGTEAADVVGRRLGLGVVARRQAELLVVARLGVVEELLVALEALRGRAPDDRGYGAPLGGHEFGEVEELFVFRLNLM